MDYFDKILDSCKYVVDNSKYVKINEDKMNNLIKTTNICKQEHYLLYNPCNILILMNLFFFY